MTRHSLPGEGGETAWFDRLNRFEQQETKRQVKFKRQHWPELPDGMWSKRRNYSYPHILPDEHLEKAFYQPIADAAIAYFQDNDIAIHSEALNLRSSQVACVNVMFPLKLDRQQATVALRPLLPGVTSIRRMEFEYTGDENATQWLGEPAGGKAGQNRTSIDVAIWWENTGRRVLTLAEWKYTEHRYGTCGGFESSGNKNKSRCRELDVMSTNVAQSCYLTQGRNTRRYWSHMAEAGIDLTSLVEVGGCPFRGPFYQLLRQYLLAAYLRESEEVDKVDVALITFRGNSSVRRVPLHLKQLGDNIIDAWNSALVDVPRLRLIEVEDIVGAMRTYDSAAARSLADYLNERYGL